MKTGAFTVNSKELELFLSSTDDGVFYVGHASILVRLNNKKFLFDPVFERPPYLESWVFYPSQVLDSRLLDVDAVIVSHFHQDHFDTDFLSHLSPKTKIYIIGGRPEFTRMFQNAGLTAQEIPFRTEYELGDGITIYGTLHEYNTIDSSTVIKNSNFSVYHGNDNYITKASIEPMIQVMGPVDVGCVPFSFIHWYPFLLENVDEAWKQTEAKRLIEKYLDLGIEQAQALDAKLVIPFGANLVYHDDANSVMNKSVLSPIDFVNYARSKLPKPESDRYKPLFAGDYVLKPKSDEMLIVHKEVIKEQFITGLQKHLEVRKSASVIPEMQIIESTLLSDLSWLEKKIEAKCTEKLSHVIRIQCSDQPDYKIEIDLGHQTAKAVGEWNLELPYHHFKVESIALKPWLKKEISFEEIIGTRRFRIERHPNEYNLKILEILNNVL